MFLKDAVLDIFLDTRGCSPSLASFFGGKNKLNDGGKHTRENMKKNSIVASRSSTFNIGLDRRLSDEGSTRHLGEAVKQLAPPNLQNQLTVSNTTSNANVPPVQMKRELGMHQRKFWGKWVSRGLAGGVASILFGGCIAFATVKLLCPQLLQTRTLHKLESSYPDVKTSTIAWSTGSSDHRNGGPAFLGGRNILGSLSQMVVTLKKKFEIPTDSSVNSNGASSLVHKRQMPLEDAEALVKQWQAVKAEALGPSHKAITLFEVLDDPMLSQWQDLADSAKSQSCFWRFVLLNVLITRADIILDGAGKEMVEIEAVLEEAAELVEKSQLKNPSYYSMYKITYHLKRQFDGSWRFYAGNIQTLS